jgi:hypothetical protein
MVKKLLKPSIMARYLDSAIKSIIFSAGNFLTTFLYLLRWEKYESCH